MTLAHHSTDELTLIAEAEFAATPEAASQARHFIIDHLGHGMPRDDIALVAAELLSNAVDHAAGATFTVRLHTGKHFVRITVTHDAGPGRPRARPPVGLATRGRGLLLVDALAYGWATVTNPGGRRHTWTDLPKRRTP